MFAVMPLAAALAAIIAFLVATGVPDRVRLHLDAFYRRDRIVALDHEFANAGAPLGGVVLDHHRQARAGAQFLGERIVQQPPVATLPLEVNARDVQGTIASIANGERAVRTAACVHPAESRRACDGELPRRRNARNLYAQRADWIVAAERDGCGLGSEARGLKSNRQWQRVARTDRNRVRDHLRRQKLAGA